ncbi:uncharacterized protein DDB_G0290685-like [Toxorhynchites rutilus septentrionalis]|uniref:uncharacterized protein DDB_G0290685-like n=1 Tax=Toxorhynchites rutilus septentrionalis TaxID=329112 RepID=UPI002478AFDE|nr:uncharacterized protein DDB_G0290685-like [Toxorhynchites rutilus septentrionalis]
MFKIAATLILLGLVFGSALPQDRLRSRGNQVGDVRSRGSERQVPRARGDQNAFGGGQGQQNGARGWRAEEDQGRQELEEQNQGELPEEEEAEQNGEGGEQNASDDQNEQGVEENGQREQQDEQGDESSGNEQSMANYEYAYGVADPQSGDYKDQWEKRVGNRVKGFYSFEQSDGKTRLVEYEVDGKKGFEAIVTEIKQDEGKKEEQSEGDGNDNINEIGYSYTKVKLYNDNSMKN